MQGGGRCAPRERRRGVSPEHDNPQAEAPRAESKNVACLRAFEQGGRGAHLASLRERGNPLHPCALLNALAEKNPRSDTAVPTEGRAPTGGVPPGAPVAPGAGARQGQPPQKGGIACYAIRARK